MIEPKSLRPGIEPKGDFITTGNDTLDYFLGGGFIPSSINIFEREGPSSRPLDRILNMTFASATLVYQYNLIVVDFNTLSELTGEKFLTDLPVTKFIRSDLMYKDVREKDSAIRVKIAWRYSNKNDPLSPEDESRMRQVDFSTHLSNDRYGRPPGYAKQIIVDRNFSIKSFFHSLDEAVAPVNKKEATVNIVIRNLLHPFSPLIDSPIALLEFLYCLRCFARTLERGAILINYDRGQCKDHSNIRQQLYNLADCVVSIYSYESGESRLAGYQTADGTLQYLKIPKINTFGLHFQPEVSNWGYRLTKDGRFLVIDELSLPPAKDDDTTKLKPVTKLLRLGPSRRPMEVIGLSSSSRSRFDRL